jgi:hypothetical protein
MLAADLVQLREHRGGVELLPVDGDDVAGAVRELDDLRLRTLASRKRKTKS